MRASTVTKRKALPERRCRACGYEWQPRSEIETHECPECYAEDSEEIVHEG